MSGQRLREYIIAIAVMALLAVAVMLWMRQFDPDLPQIAPAGRIDSDTAPIDAPTPPAAPVRATPAESPAAWFSDADYPAEAQRREWDGTTAFQLKIDASGKVDSCVIKESSGHAILDDMTCTALTRRARFTPARDTSGKAVPDSYGGRVTWRLPD